MYSDCTVIFLNCVVLAKFWYNYQGWRIRGVEDINEDSLSLFTLLDPR